MNDARDISPRPYRSHTERQDELLARGLIRLDGEDAGSLPSPSVPGGRVPIAMPQAPSNTGVFLRQLITAISARATRIEAEQIMARSEQMRVKGIIPENDAFFYTDLHAMNIISHAIEERVIADRLDCEVYAGFQRLSLMKPQIRRYQALLHTARHVYVYGLNDAQDETSTFLNSPRLIPFIIDPRLETALEWFWFVVVDDPRLHTALLAQHTSGDLWSHAQGTRTYTGVWTFDVALVRDIVAALRHAGRTLFYAR